jgi:hypothetical protein
MYERYATNVGQLRGTDEVDISETDSFGYVLLSSPTSPYSNTILTPPPSIRDITSDFSACLPDSDLSSSTSLTTVTSTSTVTPAPASTASSFTPAIIASETFSDWDPVLETITYTTTAATSAFTPAIIASETFSDWDPVMETTTYVSAVPTFV